MERWLRQDRDKIELGLERPRAVWERLGARPPGRRVVIVGGTNGKGSCVEALRRLAQARGLRVGATYSPHLRSYRERLLLPEGPVDPEILLRAARRVEAARAETPLTWFEFLVLAILEVMADADLDLALLEVGLGGRGDVINMVEPDVSAITGVALDHCQYLGNDLESIGAEKAWIYRPGKPALFGDPQIPASVLRHVGEIGAQGFLCGRDYRVEQQGGRARVSAPRLQLDALLPATGLPARSVALGLVAARHLWPQWDAAGALRGLGRLELPGRCQYLRADASRPEILLDVAHNPEAMGYLAAKLRGRRERVALVFGAMRDKDVAGMVAPMRDLDATWHLCASDAGTRPLGVEDLRGVLRRASISGAVRVHKGAGSVARALGQAVGEGGRVVVCGSFYVVGEALEHLGAPSLPLQGWTA